MGWGRGGVSIGLIVKTVLEGLCCGDVCAISGAVVVLFVSASVMCVLVFLVLFVVTVLFVILLLVFVFEFRLKFAFVLVMFVSVMFLLELSPINISMTPLSLRACIKILRR